VTGILADYNCEGHVTALITALETGRLAELWIALRVDVLTFRVLGLPSTTPDDELWRLCQQKGIVLVTANRNADGPDSLEAVIRAENGPDHLPVLTIGDVDRVLDSREYATQAAEQLLDYLFRIDGLRGTGRLYLP
jgi:hypothetical protein